MVNITLEYGLVSKSVWSLSSLLPTIEGYDIEARLEQMPIPATSTHFSSIYSMERNRLRPLLLTLWTSVLFGSGMSLATSAAGSAAITASSQTEPVLSMRATSVYQPIELPDLGSVPSLFQQQQERKIGEAILREINQQAPVFEDPWVQDELMALFRLINAQAGLSAPVAFMVLRDPQINAFAVPGGLVAMHTGLILNAQNMDEVAGVMAHEVAHVSQRHFSRRQEDLKYSKWLPLGGILAGILMSKTDGDAASAAVTGAQALMVSQALSYSRNQEREADRIGMQLMYTAGFAPSAMSDFFDVMQRRQSSGLMSVLPDFLFTHPLGQERMSEARLRALQYPARSVSSAQPQQQFEMLKGRIAALTGTVSAASLRAADLDDDASRLTLATRYQIERQFEQARQLVQQVRQRHPDWLLAHLVAAETELAAGQAQAAIDILLPQQRVMPENRSLNLRLAEAYVAADQPQSALDLLQPLSRRFAQDVLVWQGLHQAVGQLPETAPHKAALMLRYRAEELFWRGEVDAAIVQLERAEVLAKSSQSLQAQISQRIRQMREDRARKLN